MCTRGAQQLVGYADWQRGGTSALKAAGRAGRIPRLSSAGLTGRCVRAAVHGFATDLWTLDRVATVIEATTGVRYHPGHVWKLLRDRVGWSRQRPARRADELIGLVDDGTLPGIGSFSILHGRSAAT